MVSLRADLNRFVINDASSIFPYHDHPPQYEIVGDSQQSSTESATGDTTRHFKREGRRSTVDN